MREQLLFTIITISIICFIISIPFGILRSRYKKFSIKWFAAIHAPIPVSIIARYIYDLHIWYALIFLTSCIAGQLVGSLLFTKKKRKNNTI